MSINVMHAKPDLRVFLKWMITRSGSVITDVMPLPMDRFAPIPTQNYSIATRLCERTTVGISAELNGNFQHHTMGFLLSLGGEFFLM